MVAGLAAITNYQISISMKKTRICAHCGKEFLARRGMQKYCCEECKNHANDARKNKRRSFLTAVEPLIDLGKLEYLTFAKAALLMGCSRQYIYKIVREGKLPASRLSSRMSLIRKTDIEKMLEGNPYHRVLPTDLPRIPRIGKKKKDENASFSSSSLPSDATPDTSTPTKEPESLDYITGEEVMNTYKVKKTWLYTTAKNNGIPICRIAGKTYYSREHVDKILGISDEIRNISEWVTTEEATQLYGLCPQSLRSAAYRKNIPTKREYGHVCYSKSHLDDWLQPELKTDDRYFSTSEAAEKYGLTMNIVQKLVKSRHLSTVRVGKVNMLLKEEFEKVMEERLSTHGSYRFYQ